MRFPIILAFALLAAAPADAQTLEKLRKSGTIALGYIEGAAPFSYTDGNGEPQGYSVELCRAVADGIAAQLKRESLKIRWVKLTIQDRIDAVRQGRADLECSTTTWTLERQRLVDFSLITFVDGASLLVGAQSDIGQMRDLDGKRIAVIAGTTTEKALRDALTRRAVKAELVSIKTRDEGLALLGDGKVEALASDRTALIGLVVMSGGHARQLQAARPGLLHRAVRAHAAARRPRFPPGGEPGARARVPQRRDREDLRPLARAARPAERAAFGHLLHPVAVRVGDGARPPRLPDMLRR